MLPVNQAYFLAIDFEYRQQGRELESQVSEIGLAQWQINGAVEIIDDHQFEQGDTLENYWPQFAHQIHKKTVLVAHARGTEKKFLQKAYPHLTELLWVDTLVLSKALYPDLGNYELSAVCSSLGLMPAIQNSTQTQKLKKAQWHSAGYDAVACLELWKYLVQQAGWQEYDLLRILAHFKLS